MNSKPRPKQNSFLPRGYLSATQIILVNRNPEEYVRRYIYGEESRTSEYMELGKLVADVFDGKRTDPAAEAIKEFIPKYKKREHGISCQLKQSGEAFILKGVLDGYNPKTSVQGEYKTSTKRWTPRQVYTNLQLRIYALIHYKNTGAIPQQELTWIGTKFEDGELILSGEFETHSVQYTLKEMLETEAETWRAFKKIISLVKHEYDKI